MADSRSTSLIDMWNYLLERRHETLRRAGEELIEDREAWTVIEATEETMLGLVAPSLALVRVKLGLLWSGTLHGKDRYSRQKLLVLEDLRDLDKDYPVVGDLIAFA